MIRGSWLRYVRLFQTSKLTLLLSFLFAVTQAALLIPVAIVLRGVFDKQIPNGDVSGLIVSGFLVLALYLGSAAVALLTKYTVLRAVKPAIARLRFELIQRIYRLPRAYFDRNELGILQSIVVQDSERVDVMSNALVGLLLPAVVVSLGLGATLAYLNAFLFVVLLAVVPVLILIGRLLGRAMRRSAQDWHAAFNLFSAQTLLALRAMTLTKVHGAEDVELASRKEQIDDLSRAGTEVSWLQGAYTIVQGTVTSCAGIVVLVVGGREVALHEMTIGDLLAFYAIVALLLRQVTTILTAVPNVVAGSVSLQRLDRLADDAAPEPYVGSDAHELAGGFSLADVSFSYGDRAVLDGLTLVVAPGEHVAIVGPNGAGKSTLLNLILGLYRPQSGTIAVDGVPYDRLDIRSVRRQMGVVLQDPLLLPGTVRDNIAYGRPDATDEDVRQAAHLATADTFIETLPNGYESDVGDDGGLLSGGQRQRIAIARALIGQPALLILDEPTSHLDDTSIARLMGSLRGFPGSPTVVVITHDPEAAQQADRIYRFRDGHVVIDEHAFAVDVSESRLVGR